MADDESKENLRAQCRCRNNLLQELETERARGRPWCGEAPSATRQGVGSWHASALDRRSRIKRNRICLVI
jgi:hypothetical protein